MMKTGSKRIFFVTSSIPESKSDWKSVFIGDMLSAFSTYYEKVIYWGPPGNIPDNAENSVNLRCQSLLSKMTQKGGIASILRSGAFIDKIYYPAKLLLGIRSSARKYHNEFDTYFVNWLQNSISIPSDGKPLVVNVLGSDMELLKYRVVRLLLKSVFSKRKTMILPNAKWMINQLNEFFGDVASIEFLPLGIKESWFEESNRMPSKWISVSRITDKKVRRLFDWGNNIFTENDKLTLIGPNQEAVEIPDWITATGAATMQELKEQWYPQAKALIFLSEHDEGRPQTIIESMAAGVPVICLDKPLYREFIESGFNGYLVNDEAELAASIKMLREPSNNQKISMNARTSILDKVGSWQRYVHNVDRML